MLTTASHTKLLHATDFFQKAHTTRTLNTARHVGTDQWANIFVKYHAFFFGIARATGAISHRNIL